MPINSFGVFKVRLIIVSADPNVDLAIHTARFLKLSVVVARSGLSVINR